MKNNKSPLKNNKAFLEDNLLSSDRLNDDEFDRATNQNYLNKEDSLNFESEEIQSNSDAGIIYSGRPAKDDEDAKKIANIVIVQKKTQSRENRKVNS